MKVILVHTPFNPKRPLTIISHLIRKIAGTFWNHCAFLIEDKGVKYVLESDINGVLKVPYADWVKEQTVRVYEVPEEIEFNTYNRAFSMVGKYGYSFIDLFWFMPIFILTNKFYGLTKEESCNKPTCYEYVSRCLQFNNWWRMTPNELKTELFNRNYKFVGEFKAKDL